MVKPWRSVYYIYGRNFPFQTCLYYKAYRTEVKANKQYNILTPVLRQTSFIFLVSFSVFLWFILRKFALFSNLQFSELRNVSDKSNFLLIHFLFELEFIAFYSSLQWKHTTCNRVYTLSPGDYCTNFPRQTSIDIPRYVQTVD